MTAVNANHLPIIWLDAPTDCIRSAKTALREASEGKIHAAVGYLYPGQ